MKFQNHCSICVFVVSAPGIDDRLTSRSSAAKGCDGLIFQLVEDLLAAGIVNVIEAGQTITGGEILLRRGWGAWEGNFYFEDLKKHRIARVSVKRCWKSRIIFCILVTLKSPCKILVITSCPIIIRFKILSLSSQRVSFLLYLQRKSEYRKADGAPCTGITARRQRVSYTAESRFRRLDARNIDWIRRRGKTTRE